MCSLTAVNLLHNSLDKESAAILTKIAVEKKISLCGIAPDQTEADFSGQRLGPIDAILIASDLSGVRASLTKLSLARNKLGEDGTESICNAVKDSKVLKELDLSGDEWHSNVGGSAGAKHVAAMLAVTASLTQVLPN